MKIFHHSILLFIWSVSVIWWLFFQDKSYTNYVDNLTPVKVQIINSYSGSVSRATGQNIIYSGAMHWTNQNNLSVIVSATTGSDFTLSGTINYLTGQWSGNYQLSKLITFNSGDYIKSLQALFMRWYEPYHSNILDIMLDTTPPPLPSIIWPISNSISTWIVSFTWSDSNDLGIWLSHYNIHISLDPWFLGKVVIPSSWSSIYIPSSTLPQWTLFWYIEATDLLWNSVNTTPTFFHNWQPSIINGWTNNAWWSYWWWWGYSWEDNISHSDGSNHTTNGNNIYNWEDTSWNIIEYTTWYINDSKPWIILWNQEYNNSLKDILVWNFELISPKKTWQLILPNSDNIQHNSASSLPNAIMYNNLLWLYYHNLHPLWHTMNIISRFLLPFYYIVKWMQYWSFNRYKRKS